MEPYIELFQEPKVQANRWGWPVIIMGTSQLMSVEEKYRQTVYWGFMKIPQGEPKPFSYPDGDNHPEEIKDTYGVQAYHDAKWAFTKPSIVWHAAWVLGQRLQREATEHLTELGLLSV